MTKCKIVVRPIGRGLKRLSVLPCLLPAAAMITSCGSAKPPADPRVEVLEQRLEEQTRRIDALEAAQQRAVLDAGRIAATAMAAPTSFLLIGAGTLAMNDKRYSTEAECEAAKKAVADAAPRLEKEARERGAAFVPAGAMSCPATLPEQPSVAP